MSRFKGFYSFENNELKPEIKGIAPKEEIEDIPENYEACFLNKSKTDNINPFENNEDDFENCLISKSLSSKENINKVFDAKKQTFESSKLSSDNVKEGITEYSDITDYSDSFIKLADYMNSHQYSPQDFAIYSQDPEWRKLQKQAFPEYELPPINLKDYSSIVHALEENKVVYNPIKIEYKKRTSPEIVNQLGGGDLTEGSCSSLAFAYAGNVAGYEVFDFRDGESREFFSQNDSILSIAKLPNVEAKIIYGSNDFKCTNELLKEMEAEKEYFLATGLHASIVRKSNNTFEYLELQSATNNGWHILNNDILRDRFGCYENNSDEYPNFLIDVTSLGKSNEFLNILGYINTSKSAQVKGETGYVR